MRWVLLKDLQILRRSPLVTALLVIYPVLIAVLIGFALSRDADKPRVAFLNQIPSQEGLELGDGGFDQEQAFDQLCERVDCVAVDTPEEAEKRVRDGEVLAALILPEDFLDNLQSQLNGTGLEPASVKVLVNEDDPVKAGLVDDRITALITEGNLILSDEISKALLGYLDVLVKGGEFDVPLGATIDVLGLERTEAILKGVRSTLEPGPERRVIDDVIEFAELARQNLSFADELLSSVASPIKVDKEVVSGDVPALDSFAISVAATVTLMFVTVLLVAGSLALEREENTFARLTRGLIGATGLLASKLILGIICSLGVTLVMLAGISLFVEIDWSRFPYFIPAIAAGGAGFAALGAAIGAGTREVRASSLLAFMISLPIAFLSVIPSGTVGAGLYDAIEIVRSLFPFAPAREAIESGLDGAGGDLWPHLLHLAAVVAVYLGLARLALRRFA